MGSQLPTQPELMKSYSAALGTIDKALGILRDLGMVESRQGMGTFVLRQRAEAEQDGMSPVVSQLRDEVRELADKVESLELNVAELYSRQGQDYPRESTESPSEVVVRGGRA